MYYFECMARCGLGYEPPMMRRGRVPRMMEPAAQMARTVPVTVGTWRGLSSGRGGVRQGHRGLF